MNRVYALLLRQYYLLSGSLTRLIPIFFWAAIDVVIWGFMTRYLLQFTPPGFNAVTAILGAVVLWSFLVRIIHGVAMAMFEDVWSRNFLNIFASPISIHEYAAGFVGSAIITSLMSLAALMVLVNLFFDLSLFTYGVLLIPFFFILYFSGIAIGLFGSALVMRFGPPAEWLVWPLPALMAPFVGVFYPLAVLPGWMQGVATILPPSYVFEGIRHFAAAGSIDWEGLAAGTALSFLYLILAVWAFAATYRSICRNGLLARYSAENTG